MANKPLYCKVRCQFFIESGRRGIRCESIFSPPRIGERFEPEDVGELHPFTNDSERRRHLARYCCDMYGHRSCPYFIALMRVKYPDDPVV